MELTYKVKNENKVKETLKNQFDFSKRFLKKLKDNNRIYKNGLSTYLDTQVQNGDLISVNIDFEEDSPNIIATNIPIKIIYEDESYIIINKEAGIETHPTCSNYENTLANGVKYYYEQNNIKRKIRPVNRLDKDTSGLIIFAKNEYVQEELIKQMKSRTFKKEYMAVVEGLFEEKMGIIDAPIKRKEGSILERCIDANGDIALTEYFALEEFNNMTLVKCKLKTGRTHQIRVHMKYIGHSIVGDFLYGIRDGRINRQALHSYKLEFIHPINKEHVVYEICLPEDILKLVENKRQPS